METNFYFEVLKYTIESVSKCCRTVTTNALLYMNIMLKNMVISSIKKRDERVLLKHEA